MAGLTGVLSVIEPHGLAIGAVEEYVVSADCPVGALREQGYPVDARHE